MNNTNFVQTGGVPVKAERLQELQTAYTIFNELGYMAGNFAILSGCNVVGTNVSNGVVFMNGEVIEFRGGTLSPDVIIVQESTPKEFKDGTIKPLHFIRYATFGTSEDMASWNDFKRIDPILTLMTRLNSLEKKTSVFQAGGGMVLWNKPAAQIPAGWAEVVDWRGRIPAGMDVTQAEFNTLGKMGGNKNKVLSIAEMPSHTHDFTLQGNGGGSNGITYNDGVSNSKSYTTASKGNGAQFSILNPYRTVLFIEFIG